MSEAPPPPGPARARPAVPLLAAAAWPVLALGMALLAWALRNQPAAAWDWQPALAATQPWRWWSAAFVHLSPSHLAMNLAGCAVLALLGWRAGAGLRATAAWLLSWPLTHLALGLQPGLLHYGGLSGVLHAGVAIVALHLARHGTGRHRLIGLLLGAGLVAKVLTETPWGPPTQAVAGWDFAVAPLAHATGVASGIAASLVTRWATARRPRGPTAG